MAFHVAVRGMLFALPNPVKRVASGSGRGQDAFKMFYPTSIKLWRSKEEMEALVDLWSTKLLNGEGDLQQRAVSDGASSFLRNNQPANSVLSPSKHNANNARLINPFTSRTSATEQHRHSNDSGHSAPLLSLGSAARRELLLERLPYMAQMARAKKTSFASMRQRDLERAVSFHGIGPQAALADEEDAAEEGGDSQVVGSGGSGGAEAWATDKPTEERTPRKPGVGIRRGVERLVVEKMYLSDDDIEDSD
jgi:cell cycle checkpoint protein